MKKIDVPKIEPINVKRYEFKQNPYPQADQLPFKKHHCIGITGRKRYINSEPHIKNLQGLL